MRQRGLEPAGESAPLRLLKISSLHGEVEDPLLPVEEIQLHLMSRGLVNK